MFIFFKQKTTYEMLACLKFSCVPSRSDIAPRLRITEDYRPATDLSPAEAANDYRDAIRPKHPQPDSTFTPRDRKSVVQGKSVDLGGRRIIKKKIRHIFYRIYNVIIMFY